MKRREAFTLIELLVVIAIIALLMAIIMPALNSAKELAASSVCLANTRQLGLGWINYAQDFSGLFVDGDTSPNTTNERTYSRPEGNVTVNTWVCLPFNSNASLQDKYDGFETGALWPYIETYDVYNCPADKRYRKPAATHPDNGIGGYRTYSIGKPLSKRYDNLSIQNGLVDAEIVKTSQFVNPSDKIVFLEEHDGMGWNDRTHVISLKMSNPQWIDPLSILHNDSSSFSFADGHSEKHKWIEAKTKELAESGGRNRTAVKSDGSISEDWLWYRRAYIPGRTPQSCK